MAPSAEPSLIPDARSLSGFQLPPWTRADESDDETISSSSRRRRRMHRRVRRRDTVTTEPTEPNVALGSIKPRYDTPVVVPLVEDHYSSDSDGQDSGYDTSDADDGKHKDKDDGDHDDDNHHKGTTVAVPSATSEATISADRDPSLSTSSSHHHSDQRNIPIVVGSIVGVFVLLAICLIGWRLCRRSRRKSTGEDWIFDKPSRRSRLMAKFPVLRKHFGHQEWYNIPEPVFADPSRAASQKESPMDSAPSSRRSEYFAPEKPKSVRVSTDSLRRLAVRSYASRRSVQDTSALGGDTAVNTNESAAGVTVTRHVPNQSISSIEAQYNNTMTFQQRQTMLSEMSSLSSGFGDGDIIMPPPALATTRSPHISWRSSRGADRRDTVYTEASEDMQPRFRTVNSWVRQQTGRVRKAAQGKDAPPVPELPPEQEFGMMMPDGEVPRRVESTMMGKINEVKEGE